MKTTRTDYYCPYCNLPLNVSIANSSYLKCENKFHPETCFYFDVTDYKNTSIINLVVITIDITDIIYFHYFIGKNNPILVIRNMKDISLPINWLQLNPSQIQNKALKLLNFL